MDSQPKRLGERFAVELRQKHDRTGRNESISFACRMAHAERYTVNMATCRYRLGLHAGGSARVFYQYCQRNSERELLLIVTPEPEEVKKQIAATVNMNNVRFLECATNDTWARDHGAITMIDTGTPSLLDFTFNGWGLKFASELDNQITKHAVEAGALKGQYIRPPRLRTRRRFYRKRRNGYIAYHFQMSALSPTKRTLNQVEIEEYLKSTFHLQKVLWLDHGYLAGDDTDSHIDTLARFCSTDTIAYVKCENKEDEHYEALLAMEEQLKTFRTLAGEPYRLLALPMADKIEEDGERLPATYANFLIINNVILYPTYNQPVNDKKAGEVLQQAFPNHQIIGIDCRALIKQHGSLHCVTMQYPLGVIKES